MCFLKKVALNWQNFFSTKSLATMAFLSFWYGFIWCFSCLCRTVGHWCLLCTVIDFVVGCMSATVCSKLIKYHISSREYAKRKRWTQLKLQQSKEKKGENAKEKKHCMMTERRKQTWAMVGKNERNTSNREQSNQ